MLFPCFRKAMVFVVLASGLLAASTPVSAVTINVTNPSSSPDWTHWHYTGNSMSDAQIHQAFLDNVNQAKSWWAAMFSDSRTINWTIKWGTPAPGSIASTNVQWSGGKPTSATITMGATNQWFIDKTPWSATDIWPDAHQTVALQLANPSFYMPTSFYYSGGTTVGSTGGYSDILTVLLHEMGHAMGLAASSPNGTGSFYVSGTQYNNAYITLGSSNGLHTTNSTYSLMRGGAFRDIRVLPSAYDVLAVRKTGGWTGTVNSYWLNPFNQNPIHAVPEPGTYLMLACGLAVLPLVRRARKS